MKKFRFRLARLQRLQEQRRRLSGLALGVAREAHAAAAAKAEAARTAAAVAGHTLVGQYHSNPLVEDWSWADRFRLATTDKAEQAAGEAADRALDEEEARRAWRQARRQEQVYERLHERQRAVAEHEQRLAEQVELDEQAAVRRGREVRSAG